MRIHRRWGRKLPRRRRSPPHSWATTSYPPRAPHTPLPPPVPSSYGLSCAFRAAVGTPLLLGPGMRGIASTGWTHMFNRSKKTWPMYASSGIALLRLNIKRWPHATAAQQSRRHHVTLY